MGDGSSSNQVIDTSGNDTSLSSDDDSDDSMADQEQESKSPTAQLVPATEGHYHLQVHIPGVDPDSVDASMSGGVLNVTGRHVRDGRVEHSFRLPAALDQTSAQLVSSSLPGVLVISFLTKQRRQWQQQQQLLQQQRQPLYDVFNSSRMHRH